MVYVRLLFFYEIYEITIVTMHDMGMVTIINKLKNFEYKLNANETVP